MGTPIFMAVEVQSRAPIFLATTPCTSLREVQKRKNHPPPSAGVHHNFQHNLESLVCILTWLVVTHIEGQGCAETTASLLHRWNPDFKWNHRLFLSYESAFVDRLKGPRTDLPAILFDGLYVMRNVLFAGYMTRACSIDDRSSYSPIHGQLHKILACIVSGSPMYLFEGFALCGLRHRRWARDLAVVVALTPPTCGRDWRFPASVVIYDPCPHNTASSKRVRGASDANKADDGLLPEKRPARG
ncbi:hypothetical protein C8Q79DRAFT_449137 [Trametes meyenii]|nr:hypothetical protein C8Q79DRAFT_449137 [Trametes meyenii]